MDVMELALKHVLKIADLPQPQPSGNEKDRKRGFTRRAENFPSLLASTGLIPAVTFYMSKADKEKYKKAYNYLTNEQPDGNVGEELKEELKTEEGAGYSLYLACLANAIYKAYMELGNDNVEEPEDLRKLACMLKRIRERGNILLLLERIVEEYSLEVKKLADALIG